jgi:hypothetical protein
MKIKFMSLAFALVLALSVGAFADGETGSGGCGAVGGETGSGGCSAVGGETGSGGQAQGGETGSGGYMQTLAEFLGLK